MGVDVRPDLAISIDLMVEILRRLDLTVQESTGTKRCMYVSLGTYLAIYYGNALRGDEGFMHGRPERDSDRPGQRGP